jgi:hypothetical protein
MDRMPTLAALIMIVLLAVQAFAADVPKGAAPDAPPARVESVKAGIIQFETVVGRVESMDGSSNSIVIVNEKKQKKTITVKPDDMGKIKKGQVVKVEVEAGTTKAGKIEPVKQKSGQKKKPGK